MRYVLGVLLALAFAAPAQARYLHVAKVRPVAERYVTDDVALSGATGGRLGRCWHQGPHIVQCSYALTGVTVCDKGQSDTCDVDFANEPGESHWVVAIAQRRDGLYAHTLWLDLHGRLVG